MIIKILIKHVLSKQFSNDNCNPLHNTLANPNLKSTHHFQIFQNIKKDNTKSQTILEKNTLCKIHLDSALCKTDLIQMQE